LGHGREIIEQRGRKIMEEKPYDEKIRLLVAPITVVPCLLASEADNEAIRSPRHLKAFSYY
jgi:hypothetical protein